MRSPLPGNQPRYEYTLMPTRHGGRRAFINNDILQSMELSVPFSFTKGIPILKLENRQPVSQASYPTMLFCLETDPHEEQPLENTDEETRMAALMKKIMQENDCPSEQFIRMGL